MWVAVDILGGIGMLMPGQRANDFEVNVQFTPASNRRCPQIVVMELAKFQARDEPREVARYAVGVALVAVSGSAKVNPNSPIDALCVAIQP